MGEVGAVGRGSILRRGILLKITGAGADHGAADAIRAPFCAHAARGAVICRKPGRHRALRAAHGG